MKRAISAALAAFILVPMAHAEAVAPGDVAYDEYGAVAASLSGQPGSAEEGAAAFGSKSIGNCVSCHEVTALSDVPFPGNVGPSLDGVADRWSEAEIRGIVANAKKTYDGTIMPAFYKVDGFTRPGNAYTGKSIAPEEITPLLSAQQIEDLVAFLVTLKEE
ncbi:sulfur oxidation c-type cytochrome SoxX [Tropicimonas sp. TH_r6]|uniref:sulfur oxidation c-type cytochrome SoxX n=1 Tax=Tropicimonas sp. TH_r6 TaxID=3082085 RepID=UPI00295439B7|nr:sulfur oxidation c-type cytochrome SoxX [Tropicimonas sp. TH_r6]MDV7142931.1 sulfur oxidation c-type cytochrome SoxX [Tropicimonas sp. TH_r6]